MTLSFTIPGRLPGMNEMIAAAKGMKGSGIGYSLMKRRVTGEIKLVIPPGKLVKPVFLMIDWYEPNSRRDPDNIRAGAKFILDALVLRGILANDTREWVSSITDRFLVDSKNPRVVVEIHEASR